MMTGEPLAKFRGSNEGDDGLLGQIRWREIFHGVELANYNYTASPVMHKFNIRCVARIFRLDGGAAKRVFYESKPRVARR